jgi:hypothetical protein
MQERNASAHYSSLKRGEVELTFIKERQRAGIQKARAEGVYKGRPATLDHVQIIALHKTARAPTRCPYGRHLADLGVTLPAVNRDSA